MKKLRIGILCKNFEALESWECEIFHQILAADWAEIVVIAADVRTEKPNDRLRRILKSENLVGKIAFRIATRLEKLVFKEPVHPHKDQICQALSRIDRVDLSPRGKGFVDFFDAEETGKLAPYDLDVLLRHEFRIIRGDILTVAKHGLWSFHHADNDINRGGPVGFWEIVEGQSETGVTLQRLTPELDGGEIIDKGYFPTHWSYVKNGFSALEKSPTIILKNLRILAASGKVAMRPSRPYARPLYKIPRLRALLGYEIKLLKSAAARLIYRLTPIFGFNNEVWALFTGTGSITDGVLWRTKMSAAPAGRFWADPFHIRHKAEDYVFFEDYSYASRRGKISYGILKDGVVGEVKDALVCDYHLSYPSIFEIDGDIYMMPETSGSNRLEIWKATAFPAKWELHATAFEGEQLVDPTLFRDGDGKTWLFLNKSQGYYEDYSSELYVYQIGDMSLTDIRPHTQNPVMIDCRYGRNGGTIFRDGTRVIRPSQASRGTVYGYGLNISEIKMLTLDDYKEQPIALIEPRFRKGLQATHHVSQFDGGFVIDACFTRRR